MASYINSNPENRGMVSIIIPVYNGEKHIKRCLDSICQQTYKNLEVIVVDDGSTDNTHSVCESVSNLDNRIRVIAQPNSGVSAARKAGTDAALGEYVVFVDADDYCLQDYVETMVLSMSPNVQVSCAVLSVNEDEEYYSWNTFVSELLMNRIMWTMHHKIYRRDVLAGALDIERDYIIAEDLLANLVVGKNVGQGLVRKIKCSGYVYVDNPESVTHTRIFSYEYENKLINKVLSIVGDCIEEFSLELWYFKLRCVRGLVFHKAKIPNYKCLIAELRQEWKDSRFEIGVGDKCVLLFRNQRVAHVLLHMLGIFHNILR